MAEWKTSGHEQDPGANAPADLEVRQHLFLQTGIAAALTAALLAMMLALNPGDIASWEGALAAAQALWQSSVRSGYALVVSIVGGFLLAAFLFGAAHALWRLRGPIQPTRLTWRQLRHELMFSTVWLWSAAVTATIGALAVHLAGLRMNMDSGAHGPGDFALGLALMLVLYDGYFYAVHRALHWGPLWRYVHSVHHFSTSPNPLTQFQLSPIEQLASMPFVIGIGVLLPLSPLVLVTFSVLAIARSAIGHANVEFFPRMITDSRRFSWIAFGTHHNLHHRDYVFNYAVFFTLWDRLFGTLHPQNEEIVRDLPRFRPASRALPRPLRPRRLLATASKEPAKVDA